MITVMSRFPLRPQLDRETARAEIRTTIGWYQSRPGCVRKDVGMNWEERYGIGVHLREDHDAAEAFDAIAMAEIERQTGAPPEPTWFETPVIVDNAAGETIIDGVRSQFSSTG